MANDFSFDARNSTIEKVLFSNTRRKFRVPRYQRPYAWGIDQVSEFWSDLSTSTEPYFLGSFVFCTEEQNNSGFIEITDGQQRILTTTIFTAALRDAAKKIDITTAQRFQRQDISFEGRQGEESYRVIPDESLTDFFVANIQKFDSKPLDASWSNVVEKRVIQNYKFFYDKIDGQLHNLKSVEDRLARLNELRDKVSSLVVINIEIGREEDAYEIFETTNARGVELSVADLLKNLIFKKMQSIQDREAAKEIWNEITQNIEGTGVELKKFIRYYWLSKYSFVTEKKLYREIRNKVKNWKTFLDDLHDSSIWFSKLINPEDDDFDFFKHGNEVYKSIFALSLMNVSQCYVLLLSILRNHARIKTNPERLIKTIEKFTMTYSVVCKQPGNKVERIYSKCAHELERILEEEDAKSISGKVNSLFALTEWELKAEKPNREFFIESFDDVYYSEKTRKLTKYILEKIDEHSRTREYKIDFNNVNIEHILPQNPDSAWGFSKEEISGYVHKLGNLTLLLEKLNGAVQNKPLDKKLPELKKSTLFITKNLVKQLTKLKGGWGEQQIYKRHRELAKLSYDHIWSF
jgi:uncharacterized protein with ParB-like and HNH nuclease domain